MVLSPKTIDLVISIILFFFASLISVAFAGAAQARLARRMGDDTPVQMGYGSLNPFAHINEYNLISFFLFGIFLEIWLMLGQWQFVNTNAIKSSYRVLRLACVYSARFVVNVVLATFSLFVTVLLLGPASFPVSHIALRGILPFHVFGKVFPESSTIFILLTLAFVALFFVNVISAILNFVLGFVRWGVSVMGWDQDPRRIWTVFWVSLIVPFIFLWAFHTYLLGSVLFFVDNVVIVFMRMTGVNQLDASVFARITDALH